LGVYWHLWIEVGFTVYIVHIGKAISAKTSTPVWRVAFPALGLWNQDGIITRSLGAPIAVWSKHRSPKDVVEKHVQARAKRLGPDPDKMPLA
jgi:hypothetical protein